ncbi:hypothetical protein MAR_022133 [Mya arenaria]|uniref:Mitochondria-eating protein C-terminal domain-containing protein n=1 Tax=Mya arenaria TaxID=6604 RepID=A0ABY7DS25_MYAAR|nr:uncharacterized protein LOC128228725 [Mya arenaria]XP_052796156.1 uncharacterized protein LOC128228725 [Mya arenaria]XP_052796157.1 uncharacterized protein LOC128228725 [Mya arenaria]XP_052796158.1 uncharacterized protein LOC128228725 [Mya arenaria]XP_052796159.1 uncharacterized protein LOC128228725 [Mya arenaria]WAQ97760.1 hypothetical protein MAR_022133 [Mya arenaria]
MAGKNNQLAEEFHRIYVNEWEEARASLTSEKHEEEIIYLLMRIVRSVYDMCTEDVWHKSHKHSPSEHSLEEFIQSRLPKALHPGHVTNPLRSFIHSCIKCISSMTSQRHPLAIYWIPKGDPIDSDMFDISTGTSGQVCDWTVWPAVVKGDGSVVKKGMVMPIV